MLLKIDLHLRSDRAQEHRHLGVIAVEHQGPQIGPYDDITYGIAGSRVRAQVTSLHRRGNRVPEVYADAVVH